MTKMATMPTYGETLEIQEGPWKDSKQTETASISLFLQLVLQTLATMQPLLLIVEIQMKQNLVLSQICYVMVFLLKENSHIVSRVTYFVPTPSLLLPATHPSSVLETVQTLIREQSDQGLHCLLF